MAMDDIAATISRCANHPAPPRRDSIQMAIRVCVAGATGWTGSAVTRAILASSEFQLVGAIARRQAGRDIGEALGCEKAAVTIAASLDEALAAPTDVLVDYTGPETVKGHVLAALENGVRVVVGTSGMTASDYVEIERRRRGTTGSESSPRVTSPSPRLWPSIFPCSRLAIFHRWEIIDYAGAGQNRRPQRDDARARRGARGYLPEPARS